MSDIHWFKRPDGELEREELIEWAVATLKDSLLIMNLQFTDQGRFSPAQAAQLILSPKAAIELGQALQSRGEMLLQSPDAHTLRN